MCWFRIQTLPGLSTPLHAPCGWEQVDLEPERASLREAFLAPCHPSKNGFQINFNFKTCFEDKISYGSMYWNWRITLGSNTFFHKWNNQSQKNFHRKELKAHYLLSQFVMPLSLPPGCASLSSSKEHWHIFSLHSFDDYFTAPFENRWKMCIIWIHKTHNLHLLQLGKVCTSILLTIIVPHCFSVQRKLDLPM